MALLAFSTACTAPSAADGVFVYADCTLPPDQVEAAQRKMKTNKDNGELCRELASSGVSCDSTALRFHNTGKLEIAAEVLGGASANASGGSSGLSTGVIVGIAVGGAALLVAVVVAISVFVSCRRERVITSAAKQRTTARRGDSAQEPESKWRQMYSVRMQDSMRRTEETTARQQAASSGPSFLELQERQLSDQAASPQRSFSSKKSFGRGTPAAEVGLGREESPDHSLMTGSELSSPSPPVAAKPGRTRSLKKLFGGSGKS